MLQSMFLKTSIGHARLSMSSDGSESRLCVYLSWVYVVVNQMLRLDFLDHMLGNACQACQACQMLESDYSDQIVNNLTLPWIFLL